MSTLRIRFLYEPEAYSFNGLSYLPDFYLPQQDCFVEIKNPIRKQDDLLKVRYLADATGKRCFMFCRPPTFPDWHDYDHEGAEYIGPNGNYDCHYIWCRCPHCEKYDLQFDGRADRIDCDCPKSSHGNKGFNYDCSSLVHAYKIAQSWRFEPGADNT